MTSRESILKLLEENKGSFLSGEEMAQAQGISRNAVWKAVKSLRDMGYPIEAVRNRGYRLTEEADILSEVQIRAGLDASLQDLEIHVVDSIDSTNKALSRMAVAGAPTGTVIVAGEQTGGKGHRDRGFISPKGGIYMSILLRPGNAISVDSAQASVRSALGVCKAIEEVCDVKPRIGWINDLYLNDRKICGILTEAGSDFESGAVEWMVIGIGINFSVSMEAYPVAIRDSVGSIYPKEVPQESGVTRNQLIASVLNHILLQRDNMSDEMRADYQERLMGSGQTVTVTPLLQGQPQEDASFAGVIQGVDDRYRLVVALKDGSCKNLTYGSCCIQY